MPLQPTNSTVPEDPEDAKRRITLERISPSHEPNHDTTTDCVEEAPQPEELLPKSSEHELELKEPARGDNGSVVKPQPIGAAAPKTAPPLVANATSAKRQAMKDAATKKVTKSVLPLEQFDLQNKTRDPLEGLSGTPKPQEQLLKPTGKVVPASAKVPMQPRQQPGAPLQPVGQLKTAGQPK